MSEESRPALSPREVEVFTYLKGGEAEKRIAYLMGISTHTVHSHIRKIYRHLGVNSRLELMSKLLQQNGIVSPPAQAPPPARRARRKTAEPPQRDDLGTRSGRR